MEELSSPRGTRQNFEKSRSLRYLQHRDHSDAVMQKLLVYPGTQTAGTHTVAEERRLQGLQISKQ